MDRGNVPAAVGPASSLRFDYATCKLTDLDLEPWIKAGNPVARVIEAHRIAQGTGRNMKARRSGKLGGSPPNRSRPVSLSH
jgi:hypothetical protein